MGVAAELAECPHFSDEVQSNLALIWKAGEAWIRFWLAGKVQPGKLDEAENAIAEQVKASNPVTTPVKPLTQTEMDILGLGATWEKTRLEAARMGERMPELDSIYAEFGFPERQLFW